MGAAFCRLLRIEWIALVRPFAPSLSPLDSPYVQCMCGLFPLGALCQLFCPYAFWCAWNQQRPLIKGSGWHDDRISINVWLPKDQGMLWLKFSHLHNRTVYMLMHNLRGVALTFSACCPLYWLQEIVEMSPTGIAGLSPLIENVGCYDSKCIAIWLFASLQNEQQWCSAERQLTAVVGKAQQFCGPAGVLLKCNEPKNKISYSCSTRTGSSPGHIRFFSVLPWVWKVFTQPYGHVKGTFWLRNWTEMNIRDRAFAN